MKPTTYFWIILFIIPINLIAQSWDFTQKIVASDRSETDQFGWSVGVSGNYAIVGVPANTVENNVDGTVAFGSAYIFEKDNLGNWVEVQKILASDGFSSPNSTQNQFGVSVSIYGNTIVVGRFLGDKAYIFERDTNGVWQEVQILTSTSSSSDNLFGRNIAIDGNNIVIGSKGENAADTTGLLNTGAVYVYERDNSGTWIETQRLLASDGTNGDDFGEAVAISGDYIVVGALLEDSNDGISTDEGAAYIFKRNSSGIWEEIQKIVNPFVRDENDLFANEVAIDTNYLVLSNFGDDTDANDMNPGFNNGAAFVYELNSQGEWVFVQKLVASDRVSSANFGGSVSISGNVIFCGSRAINSNAGAAYIFHRSTNGVWEEQQRIVAPLRAANDFFGRSVAVDGTTCFVGASGEDEDDMDLNFINGAGSAYFFDYSGSLSIDEVSVVNDIIAYPNPASNIVNFKTNSTIHITEVQLYSLQGELVKSFSSESISEVNIEGLSKGLYIVKALNDTGTQTFKIMKD